MPLAASSLCRPHLFAALLLGSIGLASCQAPAGTWEEIDRVVPDQITLESIEYDDHPRAVGRVVAEDINVNTFAPENTAVAVDAETVDLRRIFEDLGPIATLWYQHVQALANPFFEGRVPESRGIELAKEYIEFYFRLYDLEPAFPIETETPGGEATGVAWSSYRQPFTFNFAGARMRHQVASATAEINGKPLAERRDFTFLGVSGSGDLTASVSFVGYGINGGPDGYTSFDEDTDLTGRIALLLRYEPLDEDGASKWGRTRFTRHASMREKLRNLRDRNAAAIVLVNPPGAIEGTIRLESMGRSAQFGPPMNIPVIQVTQEAAERILKAASPDGGDLMEWRRKADTGRVRTVHFDGDVEMTIAGTISRSGARTGIETENIGAVLRGRGSLADEWVVIGAHLDHIGYGEFGTSPANRGQLHPGADDNASGTAGLLILARTLSEKYANLPEDADVRSILFLAFSAEESGLHGSRHFTNNPTIPADRISAMLNMDMIGRLRNSNLSVMGVGTAAGFDEVLRPHFERSGLTVNTTPGSSGRSDDANFIRARIPALHFFTGMHAEYHAPGDRAYTVNPAGARDILRLIHHVTMDLAARPEPLSFTMPQASRAPTPDRGYAPVRLGIQPGMGAELPVPGVLIDGVSPGTSAAEAGLRTGDIIIKWDGAVLEGMQGLVENLRSHRPGDEVTLTIIRDDEEQDVRVKFARADD